MRGAPVGEVRVFADYADDVSEQADVVVVGSGPCGAVAAKELACAGRRVILLEEGPPFTPPDFELDGGLSMTRTMREGGLRFTRGTPLATMQAIGLGGGSLVNSAICARAPDFVLEGWCREAGLEHTTRSDLDPHYDALEKELGIGPTPENVLGARNLLFARACDALGWSSEPMPRNVRGCRGSGECFTGCRTRAKQSMDLAMVPTALRAGARVLTSVQVREVLHERGRVVGVAGRAVAPFSGRPGPAVRVRARAVVLAAGCMATPVLLRRSGELANGSGQLGENLQFHPGVAVTGVFPDPLEPTFGATQGYQSLQFVREGFKLETLWAPPGVLAVRTPGFGHTLKQRLLEMGHSATWDAIVSCTRSRGSVRPRRRGLDPLLSWRFHPEDVATAERALHVLARMFFAAGAHKIVPGVHGLPDELTSPEAVERLGRPLRASDLTWASTHAFGTARMHGDPGQGVVDELGRAHDAEGLWIVDTGIFPRSPGVNPMFTGMALARRAARALAEQL